MTVNHSILNKLHELTINSNCELLIVTKNQNITDINYLIDNNFLIFGENRVQEAKNKFQDNIRSKNLILHLIGPLQRNKVKDALNLFDVIQTVDRPSLVDEIYKIRLDNNFLKTKEFFIQVNIGNEDQKSGITKANTFDLYRYALSKGLQITGLMCIPPNISDPSQYFQEMITIRDKLNPKLKLSMGMSADYKIALKYQSNIIRIGSLIFQK